MNNLTTASIEQSQAQAAMLGQLIDGVLGILNTSDTKQASNGSFSDLECTFKVTEDLPKSLLVVRVENDFSEEARNASERLTRQAQITQQLSSACGRFAHVAAIGAQEYAVLLPGMDQCSELIPKLNNFLSRTTAGHLNGDGASLDCRVGVARCPMDAEDLGELIRMASKAAAELRSSDLRYQFISRRHGLS